MAGDELERDEEARARLLVGKTGSAKVGSRTPFRFVLEKERRQKETEKKQPEQRSENVGNGVRNRLAGGGR